MAAAGDTPLQSTASRSASAVASAWLRIAFSGPNREM
jgi:hypothetical protein